MQQAIESKANFTQSSCFYQKTVDLHEYAKTRFPDKAHTFAKGQKL